MDLQEDITKKIASGDITMRSRRHFAVQGALVIAAAVAFFAIAIFLVSFIFFVFRLGMPAPQPVVGYRGIGPFLSFFPWLPVVLSLALAGILGIMLMRFHLVYSHPLLYVLLAIVGSITVISILLHLFSFHDRLERFSERRHMPGVGAWYHHYQMR